jgi:hypothetical protein
MGVSTRVGAGKFPEFWKTVANYTAWLVRWVGEAAEEEDGAA